MKSFITDDNGPFTEMSCPDHLDVSLHVFVAYIIILCLVNIQAFCIYKNNLRRPDCHLDGLVALVSDLKKKSQYHNHIHCFPNNWVIVKNKRYHHINDFS